MTLTDRCRQQSLLAPDNSLLVLCDHQPFTLATVGSMDRDALVNNVAGLAEAASALGVPTILTTIAAERAGAIFPEIQAAFPDQIPIDRKTEMNSWDDRRFVEAIERTGRRKIVIAGLWTEVCVAFPTITALNEGYEVYVVTDACGGVTREAHDMAILRMVSAGAVPVTWIAALDEWQRDWDRKDAYVALMDIAKRRTGALGLSMAWVAQLLGQSQTTDSSRQHAAE
jgi:nicotinamidase-related amidase